MTSLLTATPDEDGHAPLATAFSTALRKTIAALAPPEKPNLILLGDALDLSLALPQATTHSLADFLRALLSEAPENAGDPIGDIVFVPGNHDHLLWTAERLARKSRKGGRLSVWSHTSPAFTAPGAEAPSIVLDDVLALADVDTRTHVFYPNFGITSADGSRAVVFHHGHFVERLYTVMSRLAAAFTGASGIPDTAEQLEKENAAWIDFIWSTIGDTGPLGKETTLAYQFLLSGAQTDVFQRRLKRMLASRMLDIFPLPKTGSAAEAMTILAGGIVDTVVGSFAQAERFAYTYALGHESQVGLEAYIDGVVANQVRTELEHLPEETTFVFGHTHKPFEDRVATRHLPGPVGVINTGGWILDTTLLSTVEGASVVFTDADAHVAVLKLYAPPDNGDVFYAQVTCVDGEDCEGNPMFDALKAAFAETEDDWKTVSDVAAAAYRARQTLLLNHLEEMDKKADRSEILL